MKELLVGVVYIPFCWGGGYGITRSCLRNVHSSSGYGQDCRKTTLNVRMHGECLERVVLEVLSVLNTRPQRYVHTLASRDRPEQDMRHLNK